MSYRLTLITEINQLETTREQMMRRISSLEEERSFIAGQLEQVTSRINQLRIQEMEESIKEEQNRQLLQG